MNGKALAQYQVSFEDANEPEHDQQIDDDNNDPQKRELCERNGVTHLLEATRVREWEQFKEMIRKYERGELVTKSYMLRQAAANQPPRRKSWFGFGR